MTSLFERAGVDYVQWKAVSRTVLRGDFRLPIGQSSETYSLRTITGLLMTAFICGLFGLSAALLIVINSDPLLTGVATLTYLAFLVVTAILTQHTSTVITAADYAILAPRPVSSRTLLAIRVTNVLFHVTLLTTLMGYPALLAFTFAHGFSIARGVAAALALYAWALVITLMLVAGYATVLRLTGAERVQRALGYAQLAIGLLVYGGFVVLTRRIAGRVVAGAALPREPWLLLFPPAWYASYLDIATGRGSLLAWTLAAMSIAGIALLIVLMRGQLGRTYAERISELAAAAVTVRAPSRDRARLVLFTRHEARAVALLIRSHFRHDTRVRLGVLGIVPITIIYMMLGVSDSAGGDPFVAGTPTRGMDFLALAVLMFPALVTQQFSASEGFKGAWIYFATPANRGRLIIAAKNIVAVLFIAPYLVLMAAVLSWRFQHVGHAVLHTACLGLLSHLVLQTAVIANPRLPFAIEPQKSSADFITGLVIGVTIAVGVVVIFALKWWVYVDGRRVAAFLLIAAAASWLLNGVVTRRAAAANPVPPL